MRNLSLILLFVFPVLLLAACKKPSPTDPPLPKPQPKPTAAKLTVFTDFEVVPEVGVEGAAVYIGTAEDTIAMLNGTSYSGKKLTNPDGKVYFEELEPGEYFVLAKWTNPNRPDQVFTNYNLDFHTPLILDVGDHNHDVTMKVHK